MRALAFLLALGLAAPAAAAAPDAARDAKPVRGGVLEFSVESEPPNYDCHANISFAFLHPVAPHYSTLLKFDGANYPEVVELLEAAFRQKNLPGALVVDAVPAANPVYTEAQLKGLDVTAKKDSALQKTKYEGGDDKKKPRFWDRLKDRFTP